MIPKKWRGHVPPANRAYGKNKPMHHWSKRLSQLNLVYINEVRALNGMQWSALLWSWESESSLCCELQPSHTFPSLPSLMRRFPLHFPGAAGREEEGVNETTIFVALCMCVSQGGNEEIWVWSDCRHFKLKSPHIMTSRQFFVKWNKVIWSSLLKW